MPCDDFSRIRSRILFTDHELERIIAACDALGAIKWTNEQSRGWTGEDDASVAFPPHPSQQMPHQRSVTCFGGTGTFHVAGATALLTD